MRISAAIDPITRIEGHLKVDVDIDTVGGVQQVVEARASGTLFRGFEKILVGRDPRDAQHITERICGVCPVAHGMAAVRALDQAFGVTIPPNARIMRNLVNGANFIDSHILHFYLLALPDYVDGPDKPPWQPTWRVDKRMTKEQSARFLQSYLTAISMRRKAHEMGALFGGRLPHPPAFIVGGFTATPRQERIDSFKAYLAELIPFIRDTYIPNVEELCACYNDYYGIGRGPGNLLAYGVFELNEAGTDKFLPGGFTLAGSETVETVDPYSIREQNGYSWYADETDDLSPISGETEPEHPKGQAYSWLKAPRYNGVPFEVGPLARMTVAGRYANGVSVLDRLRARAYEAQLIAENLLEWVDQLSPEGPVYSESSIPEAGEGAGMTEAPRGALGHWLQIGNSALSRYQVITPTTWNASPRDSQGIPGPLEQALLGTPVLSADEPIEVLRVIHSMDPCLDCAVHVARPNRGAAVITIPHTHGEGTHHGHSHDGCTDHHHAEPHVDRSNPGSGSE